MTGRACAAQRTTQTPASPSITEDLVSHLMQSIDSRPLTPQQQLDVAEIAHKCLRPSCSSSDCLAISPGQPFRIRLLQAFAARAQDPDSNLGTLMQQGVPAGILQPIASNMQWQQHQQNLQEDDMDDVHLLHCQGNWTQATKNPELLQKLLQQEIEQGWVKAFAGDRAAVARTWPDGSAIGKLNVVTAEGKEPRLVLDVPFATQTKRAQCPRRYHPLPTWTCVALSATKTLSGNGSHFP